MRAAPSRACSCQAGAQYRDRASRETVFERISLCLQGALAHPDPLTAEVIRGAWFLARDLVRRHGPVEGHVGEVDGSPGFAIGVAVHHDEAQVAARLVAGGGDVQ